MTLNKARAALVLAANLVLLVTIGPALAADVSAWDGTERAAVRLIAALMRALPHLGREELLWRVHFMMGAMAHTLSGQAVMSMVDANTDFPARVRIEFRLAY